MAISRVKAYKVDGLEEPVVGLPNFDNRGIIVSIDNVEKVKAEFGDAMRVEMLGTARTELANPDRETVLIIGRAKMLTSGGNVNPTSPELYYWREKFWVKATESMFGHKEYYRNKKHVLYEVEVSNEAALTGTLKIE